MGFDKSQLKTDLKKVFQEMKSNDDFAEGLAKACKDFGESGKVSTTDIGAVSGGNFSGKGTGQLSLTDSLMSTPIKACCSVMDTMVAGGDALLANAIGAGLLAMTSVPNIVTTDVVGTTTSPIGASVPPTGGTAQGNLTCSNASVISGLTECFVKMQEKAFEEGFSGDDFFAEKMADSISDYFTDGSIETHGQGALEGTTGTGSIS